MQIILSSHRIFLIWLLPVYGSPKPKPKAAVARAKSSEPRSTQGSPGMSISHQLCSPYV